MNLFGAATSGVDPQTGSYLSKEQRVAMFQASRGQGGGGDAKKRKQGSQAAIIVANKTIDDELLFKTDPARLNYY